MNKKKLAFANIVQSFGTYIFLVGFLSIFISSANLVFSAIVMAVGAVMHIGAMLWGIKMDGGSGRLPREHIDK